MTREEEVLKAFEWMDYFHTPASMTRALNLYNEKPCSWCPVLPPKKGEQCAAVPVNSRQRVRRVLESLVRSGKIVKSKLWRKSSYHMPHQPRS